MIKKENEIMKNKKIKKISITKSSSVSNMFKPNKSNINHFEYFNNSLFPKINKNISRSNDKNKYYNINSINKNNSQRFDNKSVIPNLISNTRNKSLFSIFNNNKNSYQSTPIKNFNHYHNNSQRLISLRKTFNMSLENLLNNNTNLLDKTNFNKTMNKSTLKLNEEDKDNDILIISNNNNNRKIFKSKTQSFMLNKRNDLNEISNTSNIIYNKSSNTKPLIKNKNIPVKKIYEYYISKESKNKVKPIKNFEKFIKRKFRNPQNRFNKIYCINQPFIKGIQELKQNRSIAFKEDFDINEYQSTLLKIIQKRVGSNNLFQLGQKYREFNEKMNRKFSPKGRFTNLANRIRNNVPAYLVDRLKQLDKNKLINRAKYFKTNIKINEKKENKKENIFEEFDLYMENKYMNNNNKK